MLLLRLLLASAPHVSHAARARPKGWSTCSCVSTAGVAPGRPRIRPREIPSSFKLFRFPMALPTYDDVEMAVTMRGAVLSEAILEGLKDVENRHRHESSQRNWIRHCASAPSRRAASAWR